MQVTVPFSFCFWMEDVEEFKERSGGENICKGVYSIIYQMIIKHLIGLALQNGIATYDNY